jgi:hypothetical protein
MGKSDHDPIPASELVRRQLAHHLEQARLLRKQLKVSHEADDIAEQSSQRKISRYRRGEDES